MRTVFESTLLVEAQQLGAQLEGAGFHPRLVGEQSNVLNLVPGALSTSVVVPDEEYEEAKTYLERSKIVLDGTVPSGVIPEGAVCPVHEQPAVATCERCGTFLCARCGSLGTPPLCEDCLARPDERRPHPVWVKNTARAWAIWWVGSLVVGGLLTLGMLAARFFRF